jgi:hypothetical protein
MQRLLRLRGGQIAEYRFGLTVAGLREQHHPEQRSRVPMLGNGAQDSATAVFRGGSIAPPVELGGLPHLLVRSRCRMLD